jgi:transglutaminase superfamily protein
MSGPIMPIVCQYMANLALRRSFANPSTSFRPSRTRAGIFHYLPMGWLAVLAVMAFAPKARAVTMADLLSDSQMNPKRFATYFEDFDFDLHPFDVQDPEIFLETKRGDCIDYAVMADHVLRRDGYVTRLIRVEMVGKNMGHAICYVNDNSAYLDYNNRKYFIKLQKSGSRLREIATRVADSFDANWTFASEFTYTYKEDVKRAIMTVVKTDPPDSDPDAPGNAGPTKPGP